MNADAGAILVSVLGFTIPALIFLRRALPLRRERPELLQNGLWFMLPFLLTPITWIFVVILAPAALLIVGVWFCVPSAKKSALFYLSLGEVVASVLGMGMLLIMNTLFVPQQ